MNYHKLLLLAASLLTVVHSMLAQSWKPTSAPTGRWLSLASSSDGTKLIAGQMDGIYLSIDSGATWGVVTNLSDGNWLDVASSADGTHLVANTGNGDSIYTSTNSGASWIKSSITGFPVASSADGNTLIVGNSGSFDFSTGAIYISTDAGKTWTQATNAPNLGWYAISCSTDGTVIAAIANGNGKGVYISTNSGANWTLAQPTGSSILIVGAVAMSADGVKIIAAGAGHIYVSTNLGVNWFTNYVPQGFSAAVAMSTDGTKCLAALESGSIFTSTNSGVGWQSNSAPRLTWFAACSSLDGSKLVAGASSVGIYTWQYAPTLSLTASDTNVVVSWPDSSYTNVFNLQQNTDLTTTDWTDVNLPVSDDSTNKSVTLAPPAGNRFFRLKH